MNIRTFGASALSLVFALGFGVAGASALSVSCSGTPAVSSITWTASSTDGVAPIALLWGNGSTSTSQTILYSFGTYAMTIQATDASSTVATSTCSATVVQALPTIASFTATPASITNGQSSVLAWSVSNASSTSINNGVGTVSSTSITVSPSVTTTYTLSALNPAGTTTAGVTVTVTATSTGGSSLQDRIQALLQQIRALQQQLTQLIAGQFGLGTTTPPAIIPPGQFGKAVCISLSRNVGIGDSGDDVKKIQELLSENGFATPATGYFGPITARAMKHFQERSGIASSTNGYVGPLTRGFFERACGKGLSKHSSQNSNATSSDDERSDDEASDKKSGKSEKAEKNKGNNGKRSNSSREDD